MTGPRPAPGYSPAATPGCRQSPGLTRRQAAVVLAGQSRRTAIDQAAVAIPAQQDNGPAILTGDDDPTIIRPLRTALVAVAIALAFLAVLAARLDTDISVVVPALGPSLATVIAAIVAVLRVPFGAPVALVVTTIAVAVILGGGDLGQAQTQNERGGEGKKPVHR